MDEIKILNTGIDTVFCPKLPGNQTVIVQVSVSHGVVRVITSDEFTKWVNEPIGDMPNAIATLQIGDYYIADNQKIFRVVKFDPESDLVYIKVFS